MGLPNELNIGRINRLLHRLLQIKGPAPAPMLTPELLAIIGLEMDRPEWEYLKDALLATQPIRVAASGVAPSTSRLRNPARSGVLAVLFAFDVSVDAAQSIQWTLGLFNADLAALGVPMPRDTRFFEGASPVTKGALIPSSANVARAGSDVGIAVLPAADVRRITGPWILSEGYGMDIGSLNNNVRLDVTHYWLERAMERSER